MKKGLLFFFIIFSVHLYSQNCDTISKSILFDSGKFELKESSKDVLNNIIEQLQLKGIKSIHLVGHTDIHGSYEYNLALSKNRVTAVENYLLDFVDVYTHSSFLGETKLANKQHDSLNRRVELRYAIPCRINTTSTQSSVIYQKDENCHSDSLVLSHIFNNNLKGKVKSNIVVLDWTRSMYDYGFELLKWFEINKGNANFENIVIFNDGDGKPTSLKPSGKAGGIYHTKIDSIDLVIDLMEKVASKGTGGDFPENYIEALLYAQTKFPNADSLILIADNRACIRDYKLMDKLNKPVIVLLNEINPAKKLINYQYVALVAQTGGRLCFMNNELKDISYKNNQGYKPIYFKDTLIVLPKIKGDLDKAYAQIAILKSKKNKRSIPSLFRINGEIYPYCSKQKLIESDYRLGCVKCYQYEYKQKTHTKFKEQYTFRQKIAIKWRNRPRARFEVTKYKCNQIECDKNKCKNIENKLERKRCKKAYSDCKKKKRTCQKGKRNAKKELKKYRKCKRKIRRKKFKSFFKKERKDKVNHTGESSKKGKRKNNKRKEIEQ